MRRTNYLTAAATASTTYAGSESLNSSLSAQCCGECSQQFSSATAPDVAKMTGGDDGACFRFPSWPVADRD